MKKVLFGLLICILFIPVVLAKDSVEIQSIELDSKSNDTRINSEPTFDGLDMNYDVMFKLVGDSVKYKVTLKNNTNEDYTINDKESFGEHEFVMYTYEGLEELKANDTATMYVTITYNKEVPSGSYVLGKYNETNKASIELLNAQGDKVNPNTKSSYFVFIVFGISLVVVLTLAILMKKQLLNKGVLSLLIGVALIPMIVSAVEELIITINVKVEIQETYKVYYHYHSDLVYLTKDEANSDEWDVYCREDEVYRFAESDKDYYRCQGWNIVADPVPYYETENVVIKLLDSKFRKCSGEFVENGDVWMCSGEMETEKVILDFTDYDEIRVRYYYSKTEGTPYLENDPEVMNFTTHSEYDYIEDYWERSGRIYVNSQMTFTMPKHDVHFWVPIPE